MKRSCTNLFLLLLLVYTQCGSSAQQENKSAADSATVAAAPIEQPEAALTTEQASDEPYDDGIDLDEFTKHPFENDYPYIKNLLKENGIEFTLLALDTIHSEQRIIEFDSSRIEFLDSDPQYQAELGDLICSSDIRSPQFEFFNQGITIGMAQAEFLTSAGLSESSLTKHDDNGYHYYEHKIYWGEEEGFWKVTIWFNAGALVRIQSEISPCYYDYGD